MCYDYNVYGIRIATNAPIPGLDPLADGAAPDVHVWLQVSPEALERQAAAAHEPWYQSPEGQPNLTAWRLQGGAFWLLQYVDGIQFVVEGAATQVWATWPESATIHDTAIYLLGPILGFVARLRGLTCLHASAVALDGKAIALVGVSGAGKSTTAAALLARGCSLLSEDVLPLVQTEQGFLAQAGYPLVRLWPSSVSFLFGAPDRLPRLTANYAKCYLALADRGYGVQRQPLPLAAIYLLDRRSESSDAPVLRDLTPSEAVPALIANTYANYLLRNSRRAEEFTFLGRLATAVPARRIVPHADPAHLGQLCDLLLADVQRLSSSRSG